MDLSVTPAAAVQGARPIIEVDGLRKWYPVRRGFVASLLNIGEQRHLKAVDDVSFSIRPGEVLGLAGESGCGKSTTGMTVLKLHLPTGGSIRFDGEDLSDIAGRERLKRFRRGAQIVFQKFLHLAAALADEAYYGHIRFGVSRHHRKQYGFTDARA